VRWRVVVWIGKGMAERERKGVRVQLSEQVGHHNRLLELRKEKKAHLSCDRLYYVVK
jgi:hypothetical protein